MKSKIRLSCFIKKLLATGYWLLAITLTGWTQVNITGTVTDKNTRRTLSGANITVLNTFLSTASNKDGYFEIHHLQPAACSLKLSFMGYKTIQQEIILHHDTILNFGMEPAALLGEEVNIIATRAQQTTPVAYSTMIRNEIESVNTGKDLPYLLQSIPSVVVTSDAGTGIGYTGINIRGSDLTRINVTLNGIPMNDAESQGVWFVDLPDLASSTGNIQIQRGVGTSTNGAGAFGASINIQSDQINPKPFGELEASGGSFRTLKTTFRFGSGLIKEKFAFEGRASYITSDGYIDRGSALLKSFFLSGGYFTKNTTIRFNIIGGHEKTYQAWEGVPKDSLATNRTYNPSGEYYDKNGQIRYYDNQTDNYWQTHYQLIFSQKIGEKLNLNAALHYTNGYGYYESYEQDQSFASYGLMDVIIGLDTIKSTDLINRKLLSNDFYGITFSANYIPGKDLKLVFGGALNRYNGQHYGKIIWAEYASNGDINRNWYSSPGIKDDYNLFVKANYRILQKLNLFADLQYRYVYHKMTGTLEDLRTIDQVHKFDFFNPKIGIYYNLNDNNDLYLSFAIGNREPNRNNYEVAEPSVMPTNETLYDYEFGYNLNLRNFTTGINLYYMNYRDQLVLTGRINSVGEAIMTNVPHSFRTGIEVTAAANPFYWLKWDFTTTLSVNKILNFTEYVDSYDSVWNFIGQRSKNLGKRDLSFSPSFIFTNTFTFKPWKILDISWNARYVGKQYIDNTSSNDRMLDPWFVNNISARLTFTTKTFREIGLNLMFNNILSEKYETNAWVYRYYMNNKEQEMNGYFPQALFHILAGISLKI